MWYRINCPLLFSYTITESVDQKWGAPVGNRWNGMVGMVYRKVKRY